MFGMICNCLPLTGSKVVSRRETVVETFNLHVGPWIDDGNAIVIGKAR